MTPQAPLKGDVIQFKINMIMRKIFLFGILFSAMALTGCNDDVVEPSPKPDPGYDNLRDSIGNATRPTDWIATELGMLDQTLIDRIVVTEDEIPVPVDVEEDLMAAFVNGECRAQAMPQIVANNKKAFMMNVMQKMEGESSNLDIELRYYSNHNKRIYIAAPFAFEPGSMNHGSLSYGGYQAKWR